MRKTYPNSQKVITPLRKYIFTNVERQMISAYLRDGTKRRHLNVLLSLIRRNERFLLNEIKLLSKVSRKAGPTGKRKGKKSR